MLLNQHFPTFIFARFDRFKNRDVKSTKLLIASWVFHKRSVDILCAGNDLAMRLTLCAVDGENFAKADK